MQESTGKRSNEEWLAALGDPDAGGAEALEELRGYLTRVLRKILRRFDGLTEHDICDFTQDTLVQLIEYQHTFRGESAFTTWATTVATRIAFTELRRRGARQRGQRRFEDVRRRALDPPSAEQLVSQGDLLTALRQAIEERLTDRQKVAILAELEGIPTVEIARQMDTTQNALYKLVHDGRKKLRAALLASGFTADSIHDLTRGGFQR